MNDESLRRLEIRGVSAPVWRQIRAEAVRRNVPVGQFVSDILRAWLDQQRGKERQSGNH